MAFPTTALPVTVEIAPGADPAADPGTWTWVDITSSVRLKDRIHISGGRPDGAGRVDPSVCRLRLDNRTGDFTPRNPLGQWYGTLGRNTPLRVRVDPGTGAVTRFSGFVSSWPPRWDQSGRDATVPIEANGVLRRLGQGQTLRSPLYRSITSDATQPIAYWPLEDERGTMQAASGLVGGTPMPGALNNLLGPLDPVVFGAYTSLHGALQTPDVTEGRLEGPVSGGSATSWHWEFMLLFEYPASLGMADALVGLLATTSATMNRFVVLVPADDTDGFAIYIDNGAPPAVANTVGPAMGSSFDTAAWHHVAVTAEQSGGNVVTKLYLDGVLQLTDTTAGTLGAPVRCAMGQGLAYTKSFGHVLVGNGLTLSSMVAAADGYTAEAAHTRISRLCDEESIQYTSSATSSETMGVQDEHSLLDLLEECAEADQGVLYEDGFGLGYLSRAERYNRTAALMLDFNAGQVAEPPEPTDDDQTLRNRWAVRRRDGSWATVEDTDSVATVGLYDDEITVNVETDDVLANHAAWRLHVGTTDEMRWPRIDINLAAAPELIDDWLSCGVGSRMTAVNPPAEVAGDDIDVIIEGYSEVLGFKDWDVELNCSPAQPWNVATVSGSGTAEARVGTDGSTLNGAHNSTTTSLSVASSGNLWTTTATFAADFPFDVDVGGERITVTAISGTSSPQTFTVTRSVNGIVKSHSSGAQVRLWKPAVVGL